jgi:hypothetical protein
MPHGSMMAFDGARPGMPRAEGNLSRNLTQARSIPTRRTSPPCLAASFGGSTASPLCDRDECFEVVRGDLAEIDDRVPDEVDVDGEFGFAESAVAELRCGLQAIAHAHRVVVHGVEHELRDLVAVVADELPHPAGEASWAAAGVAALSGR